MNKSSRYERRARVIDLERLTTTGAIIVTFQVIDDLPFSFQPGNFVGIDCDLPGVGYRRSPYCIFSPPDQGRTFQLFVRLVPEGPVSSFLGSLRAGDCISFRGPTGRSMMPREGETEVVPLATGVGLSPFNSLIRNLLVLSFSRPIRLYWGLRLVEDICLLDELEQIARKHTNFSYYISLSRPPGDWQGLCGRFTESFPPHRERLGGKLYYLCGNGAMIAEMARALSDLGVPKHLIYEEYFFNFKYKPSEDVISRIRDRFIGKDLFSPLAGLRAMMNKR